MREMHYAIECALTFAVSSSSAGCAAASRSTVCLSRVVATCVQASRESQAIYKQGLTTCDNASM